MFMGPLEQSKPWSMRGVEGVFRFLGRVWRFVVNEDTDRPDEKICDDAPDSAQLKWLHQTIKKVGEDIEGMRYNTAIAAMMEFINEAYRWDKRPRAIIEPFVLILSPFAPHLAEELWARLGHPDTLAYEPWPSFDPAFLVEDQIEVVVQVNGKLRGRLQIPRSAEQSTVLELARGDAGVVPHLAGKTIRKEIYVPGKLVNFVVG